MSNVKPIQLWDLEIWHGKKKMSTVLRGVQYGVAALKRKQLISNGELKRNIWIVKHT